MTRGSAEGVRPSRHGDWTSYLISLECGLCAARYEPDQLIRTCVHDGRPLLARYELTKARVNLDRDKIASRPSDLWRYRELLPVRESRNKVSLGEGMTPLLKLERLGREVGVPHLLAKDEGRKSNRKLQGQRDVGRRLAGD